MTKMPNKILITSDDNIIEFVKTEKTKKQDMIYYKYTHSISKKGQLISFTEDELNKLLKNTFKAI